MQPLLLWPGGLSNVTNINKTKITGHPEIKKKRRNKLGLQIFTGRTLFTTESVHGLVRFQYFSHVESGPARVVHKCSLWRSQ